MARNFLKLTRKKLRFFPKYWCQFRKIFGSFRGSDIVNYLIDVSRARVHKKVLENIRIHFLLQECKEDSLISIAFLLSLFLYIYIFPMSLYIWVVGNSVCKIFTDKNFKIKNILKKNHNIKTHI